MTPIVFLLALVAFAYVGSFLLSSRRRHGYGLISGAEIIAVGVIVGPAVLAFFSYRLIESAAPALALAVGWLGFRLGLRVRRNELAQFDPRTSFALVLAPVVATATLYALILLADELAGFRLSPATRLILAAVGAPSTKSAILWAIGRHHAHGPVTDSLRALTRFDDLVGALIVAAVFALNPENAFGGTLPAWSRLLASALLGPALAFLASLLLGRGQLREDLTWVAVLGFSALGTGLALRLGLSALWIAVTFGATLGWTRPAVADRMVELTDATERPIIQVLLLFIGALLVPNLRLLFLAVGFAALRIVAKVAGGAMLALFSRGPGHVGWLGAGLLPSGGMVTAMALSVVPAFPSSAQPVLWAFVACALVGDLLGGPILVALLRRSGEIGRAPPSDEPGPRREAA